MVQITMARQTLSKAFCSSLLGFLLAASPQARAAAGKPSPGTPAASLPAADIFEGQSVIRISITIPETGMRLLRSSSWGGGPGQERPEARATISDGSRTYKDVAIHLKGAAGSFRPIDDRPGMTLNFGKHLKGQTFHGLDKLSLNNSVQDSTYLAEKISRELFEKAGVPVPRTDYAVVTLNGRNLGLYVLAEGFNKQFLRRYFKNVSGNLYDGGFCQEITQPLSVNSGDKPEDQRDLQQLAEAASEARENNQLAGLEKVLDVDRFITMIAMEVILCHWDGYAMNRNNYRVFSDKETGRMVFMPHGLDQLFGVGRDGSPDTSIYPQMKGMVARAIVGTSEGRSRYRMKLMELRTNIFNVTAITNRVHQIEAKLQPVLSEMNRGWQNRYRTVANYFCRSIAERAENLDQQFGGPTGELKFSNNGVARLEGWKPRLTAPEDQFQEIKQANGGSLLYIRASPNRSSASWRARAMLPKGRYRFEGRARTKGTAANPATGVTLRISGERRPTLVRGETDWTVCSYEFEVQEAVADVELVCELRGPTGAAWFDAGSLRMVRLQ